jgi:hypothetical protein
MRPKVGANRGAVDALCQTSQRRSFPEDFVSSKSSSSFARNSLQYESDKKKVNIPAINMFSDSGSTHRSANAPRAKKSPRHATPFRTHGSLPSMH